MIKDIKCFVSGICETNSYILYDENKNCVIFDPEGSSKQYTDYIKAEGLKPVYIMLTHAHFDHIGAMEELRREYSIPVLLGELEKKVIEDPNYNLTNMVGYGKTYKGDRYLSDGEEIEAGSMKFKILFTPGHTCGSVCYLCDNVMIAGDTLFMDSCGRTDFPSGDWGDMDKSLKKLKDLEGDYKVFPGHGPATTLERERNRNMFMREL